jgi:hypothetical protein
MKMIRTQFRETRKPRLEHRENAVTQPVGAQQRKQQRRAAEENV